MQVDLDIDRDIGIYKQGVIYESSSRFKNFDFLKCILRDSIRHPKAPPSRENSVCYPYDTLFTLKKSWLVMTSDNQKRFPQPSSPRFFQFLN